MRYKYSSWIFARSALTVFLLLLARTDSIHADTRIREMCRIKGQEESTLQGLGLVVGLKGTGDSNLKPTTRALAKMLELMGTPLPKDFNGMGLLDELKDVRNVALVFVTATVPAAGAGKGDKLKCSVHAFAEAKSLEGGFLMSTPLLGHLSSNNQIFAFAQGAVHLEDIAKPATGIIHEGCRLQENFENQFVRDGKITLVLNKNHADFKIASDIAEIINDSPDAQYNNDGNDEGIAEAIDQVNIVVRIPAKYANTPVLFVSQILDLRIFNLRNEARVVVNERTGTVVIGADVEIGPVTVTHKNITIDSGPFFPLDPGANTSSTKLKALSDALNAIEASPQEIIEIIKGIDRNGQLYGRLIIE